LASTPQRLASSEGPIQGSPSNILKSWSSILRISLIAPPRVDDTLSHVPRPLSPRAGRGGGEEWGSYFLCVGAQREGPLSWRIATPAAASAGAWPLTQAPVQVSVAVAQKRPSAGETTMSRKS